MAKILVIAKCKDQAKWEAGFRTHGEFFRRAYGLFGAIDYGLGDDNYVAVCFETGDVARFSSAISLPETEEAMKSDGVLRETVKVFLLDKKFMV